GGEINHEEHEGHGEFPLTISRDRRGCGLTGSAVANREQIPVGKRRRSVRVAHASRVLALTSRHRGLLRKGCFGETPKPARETRALPGNRSERSMRSGV